MSLKPWRSVIVPREDLRDGRPMDASEFAVHLDKIRNGTASQVYQNPEEFFHRTFLTKNLLSLAVETVKRLSGNTTQTSAVFNMATQFGGGKTHALTLLYHLACGGKKAEHWQGVGSILHHAGLSHIPEACSAVFVGNEFDSLAGRGGSDGTPHRVTPWGEIAWQLGGHEAFSRITEHEEKRIAPGGDVISSFLPDDRPCLILMDELMNYMSRYRKMEFSAQFYNFLHNLSEACRGRNNVVLAVSVPASELEMTDEDYKDYDRLKKLLDRVGKPIIMTQETETSEIIRRRLFEWETGEVSSDGRVMLRKDAIETCKEYAQWVNVHKSQIPGWFPTDNALELFKSTYPFHPSLLSVFERKWQAVPRFQRTRGVLRLLAFWVSQVYSESYKHAHKDPLISVGTAPMEDPLFRSILFEQLGEDKLDIAVTTDIAGKKESFAVRLDQEAVDALKKARLHRNVACSIFFESNGGMAKGEATQPEIRLAVAEPGIDIGNVETVLEELNNSCYYLIAMGNNKYKFDIKPNLNKILSDRRASIKPDSINEKIRSEVQKIFSQNQGIEKVYFPKSSGQISDKPALTLVVISPDCAREDNDTHTAIENMIKEHSTSHRVYKSALIFVVPESPSMMKDEARKLLAWESIRDEAHELRLDEAQKKQIPVKIDSALKDLRESIWRNYKNLYFLAMDNSLHTEDLGLIHSSAADSLPSYIINYLCQRDELIKDAPNVSKITKNWPPAFVEWSTRAVRDIFFASPRFPRLLKPESIKETIAKGVSSGQLGYVSKDDKGDYDQFLFNSPISASDIDISEDMFIISKETAIDYKKKKEAPPPVQHVEDGAAGSGDDAPVIQQPGGNDAGETGSGEEEPPPHPKVSEKINQISWKGHVPSKKWMNFYTKVLTPFAQEKGLKISVSFEVTSDAGLSLNKIEETRIALRELGMEDDVETVKISE